MYIYYEQFLVEARVMHIVQNPEECIKDLIPAYKNTGSKIDQIIGEFTKKSKIGLMWDSKVPEKDKKKHALAFYDNFSWRGVSSINMVTNTVTELYVLYDEFEKKTQEIDRIMSKQGINVAEPKINDLIFQLKETIEKAKRKKNETTSSTVYNLNKELIAVQSQVVSNLQSIHWEISQRRNLTAADQLAQGVDLNEECRGLHEEYENRNRELEMENQVLREEKQVLVEEKQVLAEEKQVLAEKMQVLVENILVLMEENQVLREEKQVLTEKLQEAEEKTQEAEEKTQEAEEKTQEAEKRHQQLTQRLEGLEKKVATFMQNVVVENGILQRRL